MARHPGKWVYWFLGLLLLVSVTPEIVDAVALLPWLVFLGQDLGLTMFSNGIIRLVVGHSLFAIAVVSYIVRARLIGLDAQLEEASGDLYAKPFTTFRRVTLPLAMPAVLAGFLLSFTLSLDNTVDRRVRAGVGHDAVAGLRAQRAALGPAPRDRRGLDDHAAADARRARRSSRSCSSARATRRPQIARTLGGG